MLLLRICYPLNFYYQFSCSFRILLQSNKVTKSTVTSFVGYWVIFRHSVLFYCRISGDFPPFRDFSLCYLGGFSAIPSFRISGHFPPFSRSTISSLRIWSHFQPFHRSHLLGFGGYFPPFFDSSIPLFDHSVIPPFLYSGL